jgi:hypothetical protein
VICAFQLADFFEKPVTPFLSYDPMLQGQWKETAIYRGDHGDSRGVEKSGDVCTIGSTNAGLDKE